MDLLVKISLIAAIVLPFWNLPLIFRVLKRKSSKDISLWWALGVWVCFLLMLPEGLSSEEIVFKAFTISNFILFSITVFIVVIFHRERH
ncbi:MAG: hypothetical protein HQ572_05210 [Candidatus Omnitrophica bacterium]|nr:hypothetical protein [Candidatus Omnitrophota bacterium]